MDPSVHLLKLLGATDTFPEFRCILVIGGKLMRPMIRSLAQNEHCNYLPLTELQIGLFSLQLQVYHEAAASHPAEEDFGARYLNSVLKSTLQ